MSCCVLYALVFSMLQTFDREGETLLNTSTNAFLTRGHLLSWQHKGCRGWDYGSVGTARYGFYTGVLIYSDAQRRDRSSAVVHNSTFWRSSLTGCLNQTLNQACSQGLMLTRLWCSITIQSGWMAYHGTSAQSISGKLSQYLQHARQSTAASCSWLYNVGIGDFMNFLSKCTM